MAGPMVMLGTLIAFFPARGVGMAFDAAVILWITLTYIVAGTVKGIVGSGLPTIALGVLSTVVGLHAAMALMLVPTLLTNVWQALAGGHLRRVSARIWPFLLVATAAVWLGAAALTRVNVSWLTRLLGFLLAGYGVVGLLSPPFAISRDKERSIGLVAGFFNGMFGGMTGSFSVPGVPYLQAIGLPRDQLVQALGILFTLGTGSLALALGREQLLSVKLGLASALALLPALAGMVIGQHLRRLIPEARFRTIFLAAQVVLGGYIVLRTIL